MLKDFWFPVVLGFVGIAAGGWMAANAEGNARRIWLTFMGAMLLLSWISYLWGDAVRGPFYGVYHPTASKLFSFHLGTNVASYPVSELSEGIGLTGFVHMPLYLTVKKTWWAGRKYDISLSLKDNTIVQIVKDNKVVPQDMPGGWELNFDDQALEIVTPVAFPHSQTEIMPILQVVWNGDDDVYVNTFYTSHPSQVTIINEMEIIQKPLEYIAPADFPQRLFKYPSYANHGARL